MKENFGDRIVFWGAINVQQFLPAASPDEIPEYIIQLIEVLEQNGGYVMAPAHEIQEDVPAENIVTWIEKTIDNIE